jgi:phage shock protein A
MPALEWVIARLVVWVLIPVGLMVVLFGPRRCLQAWRQTVGWVWDSRREPTAILNHVLAQLQKNIDALRQVLKQAEATQTEIVRNSKKSEENSAALYAEAQALAGRGDDLGARAALSKLNLERMALTTFQDQLARHQRRIVETRRRLHLLELQLRQYEVGRSILLGQLAEAKTLEQQFALVNQFDPTGAVAAWHRAEGTVEEATENARAVEKVFNDTADLPLGGQPLRVDPALVEAQLAEMKAEAGREFPRTNGTQYPGR